MNKNDQEFLIQKIRTQYTEKEHTDLDALKALDAKVKRPAGIFAYIFGSISAIIMGRLAQKVKSTLLITVCIVAYFCIAVFAVFMSRQIHFWILAIGVGMFQGGIQALSRSYFTKIIPPEKTGEYFGFLDICGKGASLMGTLVMSAVTQITSA